MGGDGAGLLHPLFLSAVYQLMSRFSRVSIFPAIPHSSDRSIDLPKRLALFVLAGMLVFAPLVEGGTTHVAMMVIRFLILLLFAVFVYGAIQARRISLFPIAITPPVLSFLALAFLSCMLSSYPNQSFQWLRILLGYAALLYLFVFLVDEWNHIVKLTLVMVGMAVLEASCALVQLSNDGGRPTGTFFNPNFLAGYLVAAGTIAWGYFCFTWKNQYGSFRRGERRNHKIASLAALGVFLLLLVAIVQTGSRAGIVALWIGMSGVLVARFGRKSLLGMLLLIALAAMIPNPVHDRFRMEHLYNPETYARWQIWTSSLEATVEHPFGVGLGLYQYMYPRYGLPIEGQVARYAKVAQTAHSEYLQIATELGFIGICVFIWGIWKLCREMRWVFTQRLARWQRGLLTGVGAASVGLLVHAAFDSNLHEPALAIVLAVCAGIVLSAGSLLRPAPDVARPTVPIRRPWLWATVGTTIVLVAAVDIARTGMAWVFYESGLEAGARKDYQQATQYYDWAIRFDPDKALYRSGMAAAHFRMFEDTNDFSNAETAIHQLRTAIALNPIDGRLHGLLGHVLEKVCSLGNGYHRASLSDSCLATPIAAYEQALALEPFAVFNMLALANLYEKTGNLEKAEMWAKRAIQLEPNFLPGREWLVRYYLKANRKNGVAMAAEEFQEILERQHRHARRAANVTEERYLKANIEALRLALNGAGGRT
jgi:tetratricopeptide (TPR) repeat protein